MTPVAIARAVPANAPEILALQRLAFQTEAALYGPLIAPLTETLVEVLAAFATHTMLKAVDARGIVGSVRATERDGTCHIGRLSVHPDARRRGIGTALMRAIEDAFPEARRFELFTGHRSEGNLALYAGLGYSPVASRPVSDVLTFVVLEKRRSRAGGQA